MHVGIIPADLTDDRSDPVHGVGFSAPDINVSGDVFPHGTEFRFGLADEFKNLACTFAQKDSFRRQSDMVCSAHKQFLPELVLQIHQLARQGRLGHMQGLCGGCNGTFARNSQEITQNSCFKHNRFSPSVFQGYLKKFDRMDFSAYGQKKQSGRFERGYLKVTTEKLTSWILLRREKPPKTNF